MSIPEWNSLGLIPPIKEDEPISPKRSPYAADLISFVKGKVAIESGERDTDVKMASILNKDVSVTFNITQVGQATAYNLQRLLN
jgi:hypothetical protein